MTFWLDTGILLRAVTVDDAQHATVVASLQTLRDGGHRLVSGTQNLAEFWRSATRPAEARGGFGLSVEGASRRVAIAEQLVDLVYESPESYAMWKQLLLRHRVAGVQVHDCRIAAMMLAHGIADLLTLNPDDFRRYAGLRVHTPAEVVAG